MHQRDDGRLVIGEHEGAPQNEAHALRLEGRPNDFPEDAIAAEHAQRMHSGVTLAPIVGQLAAHELTEDVIVDRLEDFRPGRDFELVKRY